MTTLAYVAIAVLCTIILTEITREVLRLRAIRIRNAKFALAQKLYAEQCELARSTCSLPPEPQYCPAVEQALREAEMVEFFGLNHK